MIPPDDGYLENSRNKRNMENSLVVGIHNKKREGELIMTEYKYGVGKFVTENSWLRTLLMGNFIKRGLGIANYITETFVIECHNGYNKVFVFVFEGGNLVECRTERGTFNNYFMLIPTSEASDFVNFEDMP